MGKNVIAIYPGIKDPVILGRFLNTKFDRGTAIVHFLPYLIVDSTHRRIQDKLRVVSTYKVGKVQEIHLPIENFEERPDAVFVYKHPKKNELTFTPEAFMHLGDFPRYNELMERYRIARNAMNNYTRTYQGLRDMVEDCKEEVITINAEVAYSRFTRKGYESVLGSVEKELIDARQKNITLVATVESILKSSIGDRTLIEQITNLMDQEGGFFGTLAQRIIEFRRQIIELPDTRRLIEVVEEQKKKTDQMGKDVKESFSYVLEQVSDLKSMEKRKLTPPKLEKTPKIEKTEEEVEESEGEGETGESEAVGE